MPLVLTRYLCPVLDLSHVPLLADLQLRNPDRLRVSLPTVLSSRQKSTLYIPAGCGA